MLKLYCSPQSISTVIVVALNEGVHWEPILLDTMAGDQTRPDYLAINPKGRVPVLVTPEGPLSETGAILEYLGETALPDLVPLDPLQRARMREMMYYFASTFHVNHAHKQRGYRWADQESSYADMTAKVPETMAASAAYVEGCLKGPYLFGDHITLADPYLYTLVFWLGMDGVDLAVFPKLSAFKAAMEQRASVRQAIADGFFG